MKIKEKIVPWCIIGIFLIYVLTLIFPYYLFANKLEYKNFSIYYHSNDINTEDLKLVLDQSEKLLKTSDLFVEGKKQKIFICSSFSEFAFFAHILYKSFALNYFITQNVFLSKSSISQNSILRNAEENNKRTLSGVIAHETTHSLLENELGIFWYKLLPSWKNEGYCDFIANESSFDQQKGLRNICTNENSGTASFEYFKYRIITSYLFEEKKQSVREFLENDFDLNELNKNIKTKYCTTTK